MANDPTAALRQARRRERLKLEAQQAGDIESNADDFDGAEEDAGEVAHASPASTNGSGKRTVEIIYRQALTCRARQYGTRSRSWPTSR